jgi:plasmid stability protein
MRMAQALIRNLDDDVAADYKAAAKANGRAYETELRETLVRHRPKQRMTPAARRVLGDRLAAASSPGPDSTALIRESREQRFSDPV